MQEPKNLPTTLNSVPIVNGVLMARDIDQLYRVAKLIHLSKLAPYALDTPEKICIALSMGAELGLKPLQALKSITVISGKPALSTEGAQSLVESSGLLEQLDIDFVGKAFEDDYTCRVIIKRKDRKPMKAEFSVQDAKIAGLWDKKGPRGDSAWVTYPKRMLRARALGFALHDCFPDVLGGFYTSDEMRDVEQIRDITPAVEFDRETGEVFEPPETAPQSPPPDVPPAPQPLEVRSEEGDPDPDDPGSISEAEVTEWRHLLRNVIRYDEAVDLFEKEIYPAREAGRLAPAVAEELMQIVLGRRWE